jgi:hypothetical protein
VRFSLQFTTLQLNTPIGEGYLLGEDERLYIEGR